MLKYPYHKLYLPIIKKTKKTWHLMQQRRHKRRKLKGMHIASVLCCNFLILHRYTELKKSEERLSELVHKFELEKQNFAQQIHATEHKYKVF